MSRKTLRYRHCLNIARTAVASELPFLLYFRISGCFLWKLLYTLSPNRFKHELTGCWSRRINREHRLVYEVIENSVFILSVKGHYE